MWVLDSRENRGMMKNKAWLRNTETNRRALFKPDTAEKESEKSMIFYQVCIHLGIDCAKTELFEYNGQAGCLSYDVGHRRFESLEGAELEIKTGSSYHENISYRDISPNILDNTKQKFADMVFADVLLRNTDRHSGNFKLLVNRDNKIIDLLGLYDNDQILGNEFAELSYFKWDTEIVEPFFEIIKKVYREFPGRINELITNSRDLPRNISCREQIINRLDKICNAVY